MVLVVFLGILEVVDLIGLMVVDVIGVGLVSTSTFVVTVEFAGLVDLVAFIEDREWVDPFFSSIVVSRGVVWRVVVSIVDVAVLMVVLSVGVKLVSDSVFLPLAIFEVVCEALVAKVDVVYLLVFQVIDLVVIFVVAVFIAEVPDFFPSPFLVKFKATAEVSVIIVEAVGLTVVNEEIVTVLDLFVSALPTVEVAFVLVVPIMVVVTRFDSISLLVVDPFVSSKAIADVIDVALLLILVLVDCVGVAVEVLADSVEDAEELLVDSIEIAAEVLVPCVELSIEVLV